MIYIIYIYIYTHHYKYKYKYEYKYKYDYNTLAWPQSTSHICQMSLPAPCNNHNKVCCPTLRCATPWHAMPCHAMPYHAFESDQVLIALGDICSLWHTQKVQMRTALDMDKGEKEREGDTYIYIYIYTERGFSAHTKLWASAPLTMTGPIVGLRLSTRVYGGRKMAHKIRLLFWGGGWRVQVSTTPLCGM